MAAIRDQQIEVETAILNCKVQIESLIDGLMRKHLELAELKAKEMILALFPGAQAKGHAAGLVTVEGASKMPLSEAARAIVTCADGLTRSAINAGLAAAGFDMSPAGKNRIGQALNRLKGSKVISQAKNGLYFATVNGGESVKFTPARLEKLLK